MKKCYVCKEFKTLKMFYKNKARKDGLCNCCKQCDNSRKKTLSINRKEYLKQYREKNKEKIKKYHQQRYLKNKEEIAQKNKEWVEKNRDKMRCLWRKHARKESAKAKHKAVEAKRRAKKLKATPKWVDFEKIQQIYKKCPRGYHVDHIVPLKNNLVCGLHVPWNLQYLKAEENLKKGNKFNG